MFTRRGFVKTLGIGGATALSAGRGAFGAPWELEGEAPPAPPMLLHNNENPLGPGRAVLDAVRSSLGTGAPAGRYTTDIAADLQKAIAARYGAKPENVLPGCGSTQILRTVIQIFSSPSRPVVTGYPSYEEATRYPELIGTPVRAVPVDRAMKLDLNAMADAAKGAGVVFLNNPNNPTATVLPGSAVTAFIDRVLTASPETSILIDEAYHDYVTDPAHATQIPTALKNPRVIVARTFSKAHGMAGLRIGYAVGHADTIKKLSEWEGVNNCNIAALIAANASIKDQARLNQERDRNTESRKYTLDWFSRAGFSATDSQTNFVFVDIKRPAKDFREACQKQGILVGRDFPPFEKTYTRVSIGTLDEMKRACAVFDKVLSAKSKAA
jgi:histidinol-phosphate aminotransferase